jgi:hypothetical protein
MTHEPENLAEGLAMLQDSDGLVRKNGRLFLEEIGEEAVPGLCDILAQSPSKDVRWTAAKALGTIGSVEAIPVLLDALEDRSADVAWLAGDALKRLGSDAWRPVLGRLIERGVDHVNVRDGVHHILNGQIFDRYPELFKTVLRSLEFGELDEAGSMAATELIGRMVEDLRQECLDLREADAPTQE